jgi:hypothetical protein
MKNKTRSVVGTKLDDCRRLWSDSIGEKSRKFLGRADDILEGDKNQIILPKQFGRQQNGEKQTWSSSRKITSQDKNTWSEDAYSSFVLNDNAE